MEVGPELGEQRATGQLQFHGSGQCSERGWPEPRKHRIDDEPAVALAAGHSEFLCGRVQHDPHVGRHDEHPRESGQETELRDERGHQARQSGAGGHGPQCPGQVAHVAHQQAGGQTGQVLFGQVLGVSGRTTSA